MIIPSLYHTLLCHSIHWRISSFIPYLGYDKLCFNKKWHCKYLFDVTISLLFIPSSKMIWCIIYFCLFPSFLFEESPYCFPWRLFWLMFLPAVYKSSFFPLHPHQHSLCVAWWSARVILKLVRLSEVSLIYTASFRPARAT